MAKTRSRAIPDDVRQKAKGVIEQFNRDYFPDGEVRYIGRFNGLYLYLDREEYGVKTKVCRLDFTGKFDEWTFSIFKYSDERYDPFDYFFPGSEFVDGTLESAMIAGLEAYPP